MTTKELLIQSIRDFPQLEGRSDSYIDAFLAVRLDKKAICKKGKPCNDVCIPKSAKCGATFSTKTDITNNKGFHFKLSRHGFIGGGAAVGVIVAGAGAQVAYDVNKVLAKPTEEEKTVNYDDFKPGDLIRKRSVMAGASIYHYAVYAGKNAETGEHQIIHTQSPEKDDYGGSSSVVRKTPIHGANEVGYNPYVKVPESEMYQKKGTARFTREEILDRAKQAIGTDYTFHTFSSNCETFARGVVEGAAYSTQGEAVSPLTRAIGDFASESFTALTKKDYLANKSRKTGAEIVAYLNKESKVKTDSQEIIQDIGYEYLNVLEPRTPPAAQNPVDAYCDRVGIKRPEIYSAMVDELTQPLGSLKKAAQVKMYSNYAQVFFGTIKYKEILGDNTKNDSYLEGFNSTRLDRKPKCKKGKPCGDVCIPNKSKCRTNSESSPNTLKKPSISLASPFATGAIAGAALIGAAPVAYLAFRAKYREGFKDSAVVAEQRSLEIESTLRKAASQRLGKPEDKLTPEEVFTITKPDKWDDKGNVIRETAYGVESDKPSIAFAIGGFHDYGELGFGMANQVSGDLENHSIFPLTNKKLQITPEMTWLPMNELLGQEEDPDGQGGTVKRGYLSRRGFDDFMGNVVGKDQWTEFREDKLKKSAAYQNVEPVARELVRYGSDLKMLFDNATQKMHHPDAIDAAAYAMAAKRMFPDKEIDFVTHSGGGIAAAEALEILKTKGIKARLASVAAPHFGLTALSKDEMVTIGSKTHFTPPQQRKEKETIGDKLKYALPSDKMMMLPTQNFVEIGKPSIHNWMENPDGEDYKTGSRGYGQIPETYEEIRAFLYGQSQKKRKEATERRKIQARRQVALRKQAFGDKKTDSYLEGFNSTRLDRKPKCSPKSKLCGDRCIKKEWECRESKTQLTKLKSASGTTTELPILSIPLIAAAGIGGALAFGGVATAVAMSKHRNEYRANMANVAVRAKEAAKDIPVPAIPESKKNISFIVGGFGTEDAYSESLLLESKVRSLGGLEDHYFEPIEYKDYNIKQRTSEINSEVLKNVAKQSWELYNNSVIKNKGNPVAEKLAAKVYAYSQAYPGKTINLVGHSGGGLTSQETAEITKILGVKTRVTAIGTPNFFGFLKPTEDSVTLHSPNDEIQKASIGAPLNAKTFNNVKHHDIESYFEDQEVRDFVRDRLQTKVNTDSLVKQDAIAPISFNERKLTIQLKALLTRATGNVDAIGSLQSKQPGKITGLFKDGAQVLEFTLDNDKLRYKAASGKRLDSIEFREDAGRKKSRCQRGIACGSSCIAKNKTCVLATSRLASPAELTKLRQSLVAFNLEQNAALAPTPKPTESQLPEDPYKDNTIRELKKIASDKGVTGYSSMNSEQLREAINLIDKNPPEQQERIAKTLARDRSAIKRAAQAAGLRGKQKRSAADASRTWKNLEALAKFAGSQPVGWGVAATGAFLLGASIQAYERAKGDYRSQFKENAEQAQEKAATLSPARVGMLNNITFVVGSGKEGTNSAQGMIDSIKDLVKDSVDDGERWLADKQFFIPIDLKEQGHESKGLIEDAVTGLKDYVSNFTRKKDQDAIDLAAQIYAHGIQRTPDTGKVRDLGKLERAFNRLNNDKVKLNEQYKNNLDNDEYKTNLASIEAEIKKNRQKHKKISARPDRGDRPLANKGKNFNILAHSRGGQTAKTALEYLARMNIPGEPTGKEVLEQVNLVMLGTPHFGFTENVSKRQRTLVSAQDPISMLPVFGEGARQEWISTVKGHKAVDYLSDPRARESIREAFGYYQDSLLQRKRKQRKNNNDSDDVRSDSQKGIKCGKGYISVGEKCKSTGEVKEYKRKALRASLGRGPIAKNIGGIGKDIERAYIRTERLFKQAKNKIQKKELTRKEKVLDEVAYQLKHLGIIAGKGKISQGLRNLDKKLIDLKEDINDLPDTVKTILHKTIETIKTKASQLLQKKDAPKTDSVDTNQSTLKPESYWEGLVDTLMIPIYKLATEEEQWQPEIMQLK